jgi:hypothetical protein
LALRIARHWNKDPNWYYSLNETTKIQVLAEYRLSMETGEQNKKRRDRIKRQQMQDYIEKQRSLHG